MNSITTSKATDFKHQTSSQLSSVNIRAEFDNLLRLQNQNRYYNPKINFRDVRKKTISTKILKICKCLEYKKETFYQAIALYDAFTSLYSTKSDINEHVFIVCLSLVAKLHERSRVSFDNNAFMTIQKVSNAKLFAKIEKNVLGVFNFNINVVTSFDFLQLFMRIPSTFTDKGMTSYDCSKSLDLENLLKKLNYLSVISYKSNKFSPLAISCSILLIARDTLKFNEKWPLDIAMLTGLNQTDLQECTMFLIHLFDKFQFSDGKMSTASVQTSASFASLSQDL